MLILGRWLWLGPWPIPCPNPWLLSSSLLGWLLSTILLPSPKSVPIPDLSLSSSASDTAATTRNGVPDSPPSIDALFSALRFRTSSRRRRRATASSSSAVSGTSSSSQTYAAGSAPGRRGQRDKRRRPEGRD